MAKKRKNFIREKRIYCGEEYLEVDIVAVTNMPEAGKGKRVNPHRLKRTLTTREVKEDSYRLPILILVQMIFIYQLHTTMSICLCPWRKRKRMCITT